MTDITDKITYYDLFVNLLPGVVFAVSLQKITSYPFLQDNIVVELFFYYLIGLILNGLGSMLLKPFLKAIKFVKFEEYEDYIFACKEDLKIELLAEKNSMYLTFSTLFALLTILESYYLFINPFAVPNVGTFLLTLFLMFFFLAFYRKHNNYVNKRIQKVCKPKKENTIQNTL